MRRVIPGQLSNFEERMVAEVALYWIIYERTFSVDKRQNTEAALSSWRQEWQALFGKSALNHEQTADALVTNALSPLPSYYCLTLRFS